MRILIFFISFILSFTCLGAGVSVFVKGQSDPLQCQPESSVGGYFCQGKDQFLIVQDFGNSYMASGVLDKSGRMKGYEIDRIDGDDGAVLYERAPSPYDDMSFGEFTPLTDTLKSRYRTVAMEYMNLENALVNPMRGVDPSPQFKEFLQAKLASLRLEKETLYKNFEENTRKVELENGDKVECQRLPEKKKNEFDIKREEFQKEAVRCGVFSCGRDDLGNTRYLFSHFSPSDEFSDLLSLNENGVINGLRIKKITSSLSSLPLVDNTAFLSNTAIPFSMEKEEISPDGYVPSNLKDQSDFFKKLSMPNYQLYIDDISHLCDAPFSDDLNRSVDAHKEKIAESEVVQYLTVFNNQLTSSFVPFEGLPEYACGNDGVYYNPKVEKEVAQNKPLENANAITLQKANELFDYAKSMDDIAWNYKQDGCYARAHLMARRFEERGVHVDKAWLKGDLSAPQKEGEPFIQWGFHVAPVVYVKGEDGATEKMIIDPSTFDRPVPVSVWTAALSNTKDKEVETAFPFPRNAMIYGRTALAFSNSDPYLNDDSLGMTESQKMTLAASTMKMYKGY